ncbi:phage antirepressor protein [hydrocarbon metagenome]|uniref:Phage antirepressor protein n=1 Tax=hydrocarbon metagenome TaxID=938273 RepID=A0A0W8E2C4_9ZZZZ
MANEKKMAEGLWESIFNFADTANKLHEKGYSVELIAELMQSNLEQTKQRIKLAQAFPPEKRIKNVPITIYQAAVDFPDPQKMIKEAWEKKWTVSDIQYQLAKWKGERNQIKLRKTPIEEALGVDDEGMTTAKKLYAFLELRPGDYSRWVKKNIEKNIYAEAGNDYIIFRMDAENPLSGRPTRDYRLTARFAKKLAMASQSAKGEEARNYFISIEEAVFAKAKDIPVSFNGMSLEEQANEILKVLEQGDSLPSAYKQSLAKNAAKLKRVK